jgi:DNA mismatch repair ATPase MutS
VLSYLNRGLDIVVVATHDVELLDLLGDAYQAHHFREHVAGDALAFDFMLHPGRSSSRNAIALLKVMNYPPEVVSDALAVVDRRSVPGA